MRRLKKNKAAQALGRLGGLARAKRLTPEQRMDASRQANRIKALRAKARKGLLGDEPPPS